MAGQCTVGSKLKENVVPVLRWEFQFLTSYMAYFFRRVFSGEAVARQDWKKFGVSKLPRITESKDGRKLLLFLDKLRLFHPGQIRVDRVNNSIFTLQPRYISERSSAAYSAKAICVLPPGTLTTKDLKFFIYKEGIFVIEALKIRPKKNCFLFLKTMPVRPSLKTNDFPYPRDDAQKVRGFSNILSSACRLEKKSDPLKPLDKKSLMPSTKSFSEKKLTHELVDVATEFDTNLANKCEDSNRQTSYFDDPNVDATNYDSKLIVDSNKNRPEEQNNFSILSNIDCLRNKEKDVVNKISSCKLSEERDVKNDSQSFNLNEMTFPKKNDNDDFFSLQMPIGSNFTTISNEIPCAIGFLEVLKKNAQESCSEKQSCSFIEDVISCNAENLKENASLNSQFLSWARIDTKASDSKFSRGNCDCDEFGKKGESQSDSNFSLATHGREQAQIYLDQEQSYVEQEQRYVEQEQSYVEEITVSTVQPDSNQNNSSAFETIYQKETNISKANEVKQDNSFELYPTLGDNPVPDVRDFRNEEYSNKENGRSSKEDGDRERSLGNEVGDKEVGENANTFESED